MEPGERGVMDCSGEIYDFNYFYMGEEGALAVVSEISDRDDLVELWLRGNNLKVRY